MSDPAAYTVRYGKSLSGSAERDEEFSDGAVYFLACRRVFEGMICEGLCLEACGLD